jgi:phosphoglycolate phosphatase-like HAD superfamily hydrolase
MTSKSLRVGVDIDDCIFPWYARAHRLCVAAGVANGVNPTTWSPHEEYGCTLQDWLDVMAKGTLDGSLYSGPPYPGATDALRHLRDAGHSIHLVTARGFFQLGYLIREQTINWLEEYSVPHDTLTFAKDKTIVRADVFVDDSAKNVAALVAAGVPTWMVNQPHNAHVVHDLRVDHVSEFVDAILIGATS